MRLCFANPTDKAIDEGIKKLAEVCKNEFGVPVSIANIN
jgi:2-aminoadipate transaminase